MQATLPLVHTATQADPPPLNHAQFARPRLSHTQLDAGYLPLAYTATLAYYLDNAFEEAGLILPVSWSAGVAEVPAALPLTPAACRQK